MSATTLQHAHWLSVAESVFAHIAALIIEAKHAGMYMAGICKTIERQGYPFAPPVALFSSGEMLLASVI